MAFRAGITALLAYYCVSAAPTLSNAAHQVLPAASAHCPPDTLHTANPFSLRGFIHARWYSQQQMSTQETPASWNYCGYADYTALGRPSFPWSYTLQVRFYAEESDGTVHDTGSLICATSDADTPAKLTVGPCFLPRILGAGPQWIIAYEEGDSESDDGYALVSGGAPTETGEDGYCKTGSGITNAGLWVFTRKQERNETVVQRARKVAEEQGFDVSVLKDVNQSLCANMSSRTTPYAHVSTDAMMWGKY